MSTILASKYRYHETLSAMVIFREVLEGKHVSSAYVGSHYTRLGYIEQNLLKSIAFHEQNNFAEQSDEIQKLFITSFLKLRAMVELLETMENEYGAKALRAREIMNIIHRHDRNLHKRSKDECINLFESVTTECNLNKEDSIVSQAGVTELFMPAIEHLSHLKRIEELRANNAASSEYIAAPSIVAKAASPLLTHLHNHLTDMAEMDQPEYRDSLVNINARLAPIIQRVKSRTTRLENSSHEEEIVGSEVQ